MQYYKNTIKPDQTRNSHGLNIVKTAPDKETLVYLAKIEQRQVYANRFPCNTLWNK